MITSFWRSWMMRADAPASSRSASSVMRSPHVVEPVARRRAPHAVHRRGRADEQLVPVRATPVEVPDVLRDLDRADVLALRREHAHAAGARDPDVAALVELHPVDEVADVERAGADV